MPTRSLCRECDGTGWIPYHSETVDGELEEAYRLCPSCYAPRRCMGSRSDHLCPRPGTMRYSLGYYCKEHVKDIRIDEQVYHAYEAIYYLKWWLRIARDRANAILEKQLSDALGKAEAQLNHAGRELYQACTKEEGHPD